MTPSLQVIQHGVPAAHLALFSDARYHALKLGADERYLRIDGEAGSVCGVVHGATFTCGYRAPYGGVDLSREDHPLPLVEALLDEALAELAAEGVGTVRLHTRPPAYSPAEPLLQHLLFQRGFRVEHCALNQHVDLSGFASAEDYVASLKKKRAWALRKDLAEPYGFAEATGAEMAECHALLNANRLAHGRPPGLELDYMRRVKVTFGDRVRMYRLAHDGRAVAAAFVYRVLPDVDLVQAWGDHCSDLPRSPMNLLAYRVIEASLGTGARLLDIGPSSEKDGSPNPGLVHFKRSIGAQATTRLVLVR